MNKRTTMRYLPLSTSEPYRLFFPLGTALLLCGILLWVPLIWDPGVYPVLLHRSLMLNGFAGCFIGGFLMTAVPKFSQTWAATKVEVLAYLLITLTGIVLAHFELEKAVFLLSSLQPLILLNFMRPRILQRKSNPPYSFIFIFIGLFLWFASGVLSVFVDLEAFKHLHYEGAIGCIILGVGSRLIPGILGHVDIVTAQRNAYEKEIPLLKTVPLHFFAFIFTFVGSYFISDEVGPILRAIVVILIGGLYWKLWKFPKTQTALTRCIWFSSWMILLSFVLKASWTEGLIHISHSFFINGIVLLSLLIGTRVLQSHGPKEPGLENLKLLYVISLLVFASAATRVSAFLLPDSYLTHLAYSALLLTGATLLWSWRYLRYISTGGPET